MMQTTSFTCTSTSTSTSKKKLLLLLALLVLNTSHGFIIGRGTCINTRMLTNGLGVHIHALQALPTISIDVLETTSLFQAVEVFDGSTIIDPIVVSGVFWSSMKAKILSVIIGQLASSLQHLLVFGILAYLLSSQLGNLSDYVSENVFQDTNTRKNFDDFAQSIKNKS